MDPHGLGAPRGRTRAAEADWSSVSFFLAKRDFFFLFVLIYKHKQTNYVPTWGKMFVCASKIIIISTRSPKEAFFVAFLTNKSGRCLKRTAKRKIIRIRRAVVVVNQTKLPLFFRALQRFILLL